MNHPDSWEEWADWPAPDPFQKPQPQLPPAQLPQKPQPQPQKPPAYQQKPQPQPQLPQKPPHVPRGICVTVVNHRKQVLVGHGGRFPVAGFHTQTDPDRTNEEMARQCVKNMIGVEIGVDDVFSVGPHYFVWLDHSNKHVRSYTTVEKYQNKVGTLQYVDRGNIDQYAWDNGTKVLPAFRKVLFALESHISRVRMMA